MNPDLYLAELEAGGRKAVHFIGIGGIGMSALARWFLAQKWVVSGSDLTGSDLTRELKKEGAKLVLGHRGGLPAKAGLVIRTLAVPPANPEYREALRRHIPVFTYPEIMGALTRRYRTVTVSGAHGKSTTTALIALAAVAGGLDPTVIIGTKLREFGGKNFRAGGSKLLVLEADEYGRAFLNYSPAAALITNIDREHLDTYRNLAAVKKTFMQYLSQASSGGALVLNADDANLKSLQKQIRSLAAKTKVDVYWYSVRLPAAGKIRKILRLPGLHNLSDAAGAFVLSRRVLKIPEVKILKALAAFRGSWRRAEYKGSFKLGGTDYRIYDDYAHHPAEIRATLRAFRDKFADSSLVCVFQPHQAERLKKLFPDFKKAFDDADAVLIFPEYRVAGREEKPSPFTARALALAIQKRNPKAAVSYVENEKIFSRRTIRETHLRSSEPRRKAVVIMMGAGNIVDYTSKLL